MLQPDRHAHALWLDTDILALLVGKLVVGSRCRVDDERARIADIGDMTEKLERFDHVFRPRIKLLPDGDDSTEGNDAELEGGAEGYELP